jgi:hypothetical protein
MIAAVAAATLAIIGLAVATAAPASAQAVTEITPTTWAYVDSAAPHQRFVQPAGDLPVGAFVDGSGVPHVDRSYITYDLSTVKESDVLSAFLSTSETAGTDCTQQRQTQVWRTATAQAPTWDWGHQPAQLTQLTGGSISPCPTAVLYDATSAIRQALAAGRLSVTFEFRIATAQESDPAFARHYDPKASIGVTYNRPPAKPTHLTVNQTACAHEPVLVGGGDVNLAATITDPDDFTVTAEWAWWPVDHPDQRTDVTEPGTSTSIPAQRTLAQRQLADATTYAWQVRASDQHDTGPWSTICRFTTDFTPPTALPSVTSTDYPPTGFHGGPGIPGAFTFSVNGDKDVVGYRYGAPDDVTTFVRAKHPGAPVTVPFAPTREASNQLQVAAVDAAGNVGPVATYSFDVAPDRPTVTCTPVAALIGTPRTCVFTPSSVGTIVSYTYELNSGTPGTVPADQNGRATATVTPNDQRLDTYQLSVVGNVAGGTHTEAGGATLQADLGIPTISQSPASPIDGQPVQFTFTPGMPGVASYTYIWQNTRTTVPAAADGTATVSLTSENSFERLGVFSTTASGVNSGFASQNVTFQTDRPTVTSQQYPADTFGGGVTEPGTFTLAAPVPGVVSYTYNIDGSTPSTLPAGVDGTASFSYTPLTPNVHIITATATYANGAVSLGTQYVFEVNSVAPKVSCATNPPPAPGGQVSCTFTPVQPGVVSYVYTVTTGSTGPEITVPANPDGTATTTVSIPSDAGSTGLGVELTVSSVNGAGLRSNPTFFNFPVAAALAAAHQP